MATANRAKLLLVDDIEENLIALEALLRRLDVDVVTARSGSEALEHLLVDDYALALLDVNMPEMDGFQLAELMRGAQRTRSIPIIFVTAAVHEPHRVFQGYDSGAVDFLFKPVDPRIMLSKVSTFIELYESERQLAEQLARVERVTQQLGESLRLHEMFVAALNHDLRNPLGTISLGAAMLAGENLDPKHKAIVQRIVSASTRMTMMLDQLYDVARARLGTGIQLDKKPGDLATVVRDVLREAELHRGPRTLAFDATGDTAGIWDLPRLSRVAANLISNALAHGAAEGTIKVTVDGTRPDRVRLVVKNPGAIPSDVLPRIFEPFRRGGSRAQGLGLGLYIVREITVAHGGEVTVTSTPEAGTSFEVSIPRHA